MIFWMMKGGAIMPFVEAKCTNCGAVLPVDSARDAWVCGYCGTPFVVEKAIQQFNITNNISTPMVNVFGGDTADVLYNRALEWLALKNEKKAIQVLGEMTEKYPGDVRGWSKLARIILLANNTKGRQGFGISMSYREIIDNAIRLGDVTALRDIKEKAIQLCEGFKTEITDEHVEFLRVITAYTDGFFNELDCVRELLFESKENVECYQHRMKKLNGYNSDRFDKIRPAFMAYFSISTPNIFMQADSHVSPYVAFIVGKIIVLGSLDYFVVNSSITKADLQQFFDAIDYRVSNKMCLICGKKMSFSAKNTCGCKDGKTGYYLPKS